MEHIWQRAPGLDPDQPQLRGRGEAAGPWPLHRPRLYPQPGRADLQGGEVSLPTPVRGSSDIRGRGQDDELSLTYKDC